MAKRNTYFQNEVIEKKIDVKQLGRILKYVLPYQKIFSLVGVLMLVAACSHGSGALPDAGRLFRLGAPQQAGGEPLLPRL